MQPVQAQPTPAEFVPQEHTDFIFHVAAWPALLTTLGAVALVLVALVFWYHRRRPSRDEP